MKDYRKLNKKKREVDFTIKARKLITIMNQIGRINCGITATKTITLNPMAHSTPDP